MCFALVCTIGMLKNYWAKRLQQEQTHVHTITLHSHEHILLAMMKWFYQTTLLTPCYIFHNCEHLSAGKHNHVQVCTASHNNSPHFYFFILFCYFFIFLNFWEQVWAELGSFWHTDQQCNALINCEQNDCGKAKSYSQRVTTTKWRHHFLFFFHFHHDMFGTNDDSKVTKKWKKSDILSKIEQNWAGFARAPIHILVFWAILSNLEQFWAQLSKIEQDLPGPTNTFFSIAGHFEQFWAKLSRIYRELPILFLVLRAILSKIEQDLPGPPTLFNRSNFEQTCQGTMRCNTNRVPMVFIV